MKAIHTLLPLLSLVAEGSARLLPRQDPIPVNPPSEIITLVPETYKELNSGRVRIRHGPFKVPGTSVGNGTEQYIIQNATMPCRDCYITSIQASLEHPNGTYGNTESGMYLHHVVLLNNGRPDAVCPGFPDRFFASGNERTKFSLSLNGSSKTGYQFGSKPISMIVMLMNENPGTTEMVLTMEYEYIQGTPAGFQHVVPLWLDIGGCGDSNLPLKNPGFSSYTMPAPFKANLTGTIVAAGGHIHDAGLSIKLIKNNGTVCESTGIYSPPSSSGHGHMGSDRLMSMSLCPEIQLKAGDQLDLFTTYDTTKHGAMKDGNGAYSPIMGIIMAYVKETIVKSVN